MADRVICVSGVLSQEVQNQYGIHPEKIKVIYNGIQCEKFDGEVDAGSVKAQYGVPAMDPMFLFVGMSAVLETMTRLEMSRCCVFSRLLLSV